MEEDGDEFLAGAGLSLDQDVDVGLGDLTHGLAEADHDRGFADQRFGADGFLGGGAETAIV